MWNYTFDKWSENQADRYYKMLIDICHELAYNPGSGKAYHVIADNIVGYKVGRHIIFYRRIDDYEIEIVRILHEQMDLKSRMSEK